MTAAATYHSSGTPASRQDLHGGFLSWRHLLLMRRHLPRAQGLVKIGLRGKVAGGRGFYLRQAIGALRLMGAAC